ncbi:MAG: DUF4249 domain-containing protein [Fulvivirga sp.]|uniref:DUF4249 domain-containing protein n=1 Tax=Fulvivirga sp. TaxID=1931237 RepID=UPI0032ED40C6
MIKLKTYYFILYVTVVLQFSCIDKINVDVESKSGSLVVNGQITDQEGPYEILLYRSLGYFNYLEEVPDPVPGAKITIEDDLGSAIELEERRPGAYYTHSGFQGEVGRSYILTIELNDGSVYKSNPERMPVNVGIDSLIAEYKVKTKVNKNNVPLDLTGFEIRIKTNPLNDTDGFYRWRYNSIYEFRTFPELRERPPGTINPPPCAAGIVCTCCFCWTTESSSKVVVSDPELVTDDLTDIIDFIVNENSRFTFKYYIEVEQLALTKSGHTFWDLVERQQNQGSLFDQPSGKMPVNMYALSDENEPIFGHFGVVSITKKDRFILPKDLPVRSIQLDSIKEDCRLYKNSTNVRPSFW